ncbi:MAG: hypothetical protein R3B72_46130 [Polyangiaceae bacterium]
MTPPRGNQLRDRFAEALTSHPRADDLASLTLTVMRSAADERRTRWSDGLEELAAEVSLGPEDVIVDGVDLLALLQQEAVPTPAGRALVSGLVARGVALAPPADDAAADRLVEQLAWLAAHSWVAALGEVAADHVAPAADRVAAALARYVSAVDDGGAGRGRGEALAAAAALRLTSHPPPIAPADPLLAAVVTSVAAPGETVDATEAPSPASDEAPAPEGRSALDGELVPAPRSPSALFLSCITGFILLEYLWRFVTSVLLRCKRPTHVEVGADGVTLATELAVLGKTLRRRELTIPRENLAQAIREVRYPRLALYAGLSALAIGTFVGASIATDGLRSGSPSMIAVGAGLFGLGVILDLLFASLLPGGQGRHHVVFVPRRGAKLALTTDDPRAADRALRLLQSGS